MLRVKALDANKDLKTLPTTAGDEIFDLGSQRIKDGKAISLFFSGGSGTAVKRVMGAHKMIHPALHVKISRGWISIIEAHLGVALGQSPKGKIGVVTSLAGTMQDESDKSVQMKLHHAYPKKMESGQLSVFKQKTGLVLDPRTGEPMRFSDGRLALCAEDHLWAFLSILMYKDYIIDALRSGDNVVFLGNGDNVLNYSREGMSGFFDKARKEGKPLATVSIFAESSGDKQGGFSAEVTYEVTYREKRTGDIFTEEITIPRIVEISELPTRDKKQTGFTAIDLLEESEQGKKGEKSDFYKRCEQNHWFIEDIFKEDPANPDSPDKAVAFNVAFHAIDLVLYAARIFGLDENDPELIQKLDKIPAQDWANRVVGLGNEVVKSILPDKGVPNEVGSEEIVGLMTQQKVQDLIFNTVLRLLDNPGLPKPEVMGLTGNRMDFFAPYKGKKQKVPLPGGGVMTDSTEKAVEEYDLFANRFIYEDFVKRWVASDKTIPVDDDGREVVTAVILPESLDEIKAAAHAGVERLKLPVHFTPSAAPLSATMRGQNDVLRKLSTAA